MVVISSRVSDSIESVLAFPLHKLINQSKFFKLPEGVIFSLGPPREVYQTLSSRNDNFLEEVFSRCLKSVSDGEVIPAGRLFQTCTPATGIARPLMEDDLTTGAIQRLVVVDLNLSRHAENMNKASEDIVGDSTMYGFVCQYSSLQRYTLRRPQPVKIHERVCSTVGAAEIVYAAALETEWRRRMRYADPLANLLLDGNGERPEKGS